MLGDIALAILIFVVIFALAYVVYKLARSNGKWTSQIAVGCWLPLLFICVMLMIISFMLIRENDQNIRAMMIVMSSLLAFTLLLTISSGLFFLAMFGGIVE